jgi:DNA-binding LytR/AlgR family response regulator
MSIRTVPTSQQAVRASVEQAHPLAVLTAAVMKPLPVAGLRVLVVVAAAGERDALVGVLAGAEGVGQVRAAVDAADALRMLDGAEVDAVFVDVDLPGLDGLDLARVIGRFVTAPLVVFVADSAARAAEAFEVAAVDYMVRPLGAGRLAESLTRVARHCRDRGAETAGEQRPGRRRVADVAVVGGGHHRQPLPQPGSAVRWIEAQRDYVRMHTATGSKLVNIAMSTLETAWAEAGVVRIHRSYAVQLAAVSELRRTGKSYSVVVDGRELPVSRRYAHQVRQQLMNGAPDPRNPLARQDARPGATAA